MQKEMMEIVKQAKQLMIQVVNSSPQGTMKGLNQIAIRLENLTAEFPEMGRYRLTVSGVDVPDDIRTIDTVLPTMFAELAIAGQVKPPRARTAREAAAMALMPVAVEEVYQQVLVTMPHMTAKNVTVEPVMD